jgi:hypothetical protein
MAFLYPAFLFGLLALSIPVIVHLFRFKRFKTIYFSNVAFLESVLQEEKAQSKLKHLLLLASRLLAILFFVMAFAGPYLESEDAASQTEGITRALYIDNSLSMDAPGMSLSLLDEAKQAGLSLAEGMDEQEDIYILTNDFEPISGYPLPKQEALFRIQELSVSPQSKTLENVIEKQRLSFTKEEKSALKQYIIASDFRKGFSFKNIELDSNERLLLLPVTPQSGGNASLDSAWLEEPFVRAGMRTNLHFSLSRNTLLNDEETPVAISLNNEGYASFRVRWNNRLKVDTAITLDVPESGTGSVLLTLQDEAIGYDNSLYASLQMKATCRVLEITDAAQETPAARAFGVDSFFTYVKTPGSNVSTEQLENAQFILVTSEKPLSEGLIFTLAEQAKRGKNVAFFPSSNSTDAWNSVFAAQGLPSYGRVDSSLHKIEGIDFKTPFYGDLFKEEPKKAGWPTVKNSVMLKTNGAGLPGVLLKSVKGDPLYVKSVVGKGNVFYASFGLNEKNSAFIKHPLFLPILYKSALYRESNKPLYFTIGSAKRISTDLEPTAENTLQIEGGENDPVLFLPEVVRLPGGGIELARLNPIKQPGFYRITGMNNQAEAIAFNYARAESGTAYLSQDSLLVLAQEQGIDASIITPESIQNGDLSALSQGPETLWRICILLTLLFLTAEVLITRFIP